VVILSAGAAASRLSMQVRSRPWLTIVSTGDQLDLRTAAARLKNELGIRRISAIGGRTAATSLIDAGLVTDLYLTTSAISAGTPDTPMYSGRQRVRRDLAVQKRSASGVIFEHFLLANQRAETPAYIRQADGAGRD
jgi:riboflavin biosynthesis pyrimidine reductase